MSHLISPIFQSILEWLGIDQKQQFVWILLLYLALFVSYAFRYRREHGTVFAILFVVLGLSLLVFLFTDSSQARLSAAVVFMMTTIAAFGWHFLRRRMAAERR